MEDRKAPPATHAAAEAERFDATTAAVTALCRSRRRRNVEGLSEDCDSPGTPPETPRTAPEAPRRLTLGELVEERRKRAPAPRPERFPSLPSDPDSDDPPDMPTDAPVVLESTQPGRSSQSSMFDAERMAALTASVMKKLKP